MFHVVSTRVWFLRNLRKKTRKYVGSPHFLIMLATFLWRQWAWQKRPGPCGLCGQHVVKPSWKKLIGEWFVVWFGAIHWCWWKIMNDLWFGYKLYTTENNMNFWSSEPYTTGPIHGGCWDAKGPVLGLNAGRVWVSMRNKMGWDNCETRFLESDAWIIILNDILNYIVLYSYIYTHMYIIYIYPQYFFHWTCWRYLTTNRWWFCCFTSWATKTRSISPCLTVPSCAMRKNGASKTSPPSRLECPLDHSRWFMAWLVRHSVLYNHISPISLWRLTIVFLLGSSSLIKPYITY